MSRLPPPPPLPRFSSATPERRTAVAPRAARPAPVASSARPRSAPPPLPERARRAPQVGTQASTRPPALPQASTRPPTPPQASTRPPAATAQHASSRPTAPAPRPRTTPPPLPQAKRARARQDSTPTVAQRRPPPRDDRPTEPTPPPSAVERAADIVIDEGETLVMSRAELSAVEVTEPGGFLAPAGSAAPPLPAHARKAPSQPVILTSLARPPLVTEEPARLPALPRASTHARPARMESERPVALEITDAAEPARAPRFGWFFAAVAVAAACVLPAAARSYATIAAHGAGRAETHLATFVLDPPPPAETATTPEPPKDAPTPKLEPAEKAPAASETKAPAPAKARPVVKPRWKKLGVTARKAQARGRSLLGGANGAPRDPLFPSSRPSGTSAAVSTTALLLVTAAALLHAAWNALTKRAADSFVFLWSSMALAAVLFLPAALWLGVGPALGGKATLLVLGTSVVHAVYFFTLATAYRKGDFALVYPVARGLGVALAPALATVVFRESLSPLGLSGIALVVLGIVASGLAALGARTARVGIGQGAGWAIVTGLLIATYSLIDAAGARAMHPIPYIVAMSLGAVALLSPYVLLRRRAALVHEWRKNGRTIVLAATMNLTGYVLVLFAYRIAKTGYVIAAREISIVLSAFVGSVVFREGALGPRLVGAGLILAGVACVAFAR